MVNPVRGRARTIASSSRATQPSVQLSGESVTVPQESLSGLREEDTIQQAHTDSTSSITKKNVRGCTRGIALRKLNSKNKQKLVVHMDPTQGRPLDSLESAKLSSELGIISRDSMSVPIKWKAIDDTELSMAIDLLEMNLTIDNLDEETVENVLEILKHRSRYQRHRLNKHFKKFASVEEVIRNKPSFGGLTQQNWESLCTNLFSDQKYKDRCETNKKNRKNMITNHNQGSRSFVVARHMLSQEEEFNDVEVDRIQFYKHCHYKEGKGWVTQQCEKNYLEMERRRINDVEEYGESVNIDEIVDDVLGRRSSYVVGLGYGPKPKKTASNLTRQMIQEALKEKEKENVELKDEVETLKATLEEHGRLLRDLMESQQHPN